MKLAELAEWYDGSKGAALRFSKYEREVQVGNYLGALRRGGQLDSDNRVRKAL